MKILAVETSCDETAIAILEAEKNNFRLLSNVVSSQVKIHAKWGGVVPNLAKRAHLKNLPLVLNKALKKAEIKNSQKEIDLIAVVNGPGLEPALWMGINFAKKLAEKWNKPLVAVNHMEGHLFSVFLKKGFGFRISDFGFPAISLLASGGHTELVLVKDFLRYKILGQTRDDAAGEAFDKVAKMLKLGYPGGPIISKLAVNYRGSTSIVLPRPMINDNSPAGEYDFSFSGLKTAVLYKIKESPKLTMGLKKEICHEFQQAVIDVLIAKTLRAAKEYGAKTMIVAGGVAANRELRKQLKEKIQNIPYISDSRYMVNLMLPKLEFTGDNAAMIALAAYFRWRKNKKSVNLKTLRAKGNLKIV